MSRTICGPAAVKRVEPTLNMPAMLWSCFTRSRAFEGVSTSSAIINFLFFIKLLCTTTNCQIQIRETFARENLCETFVDVLSDAWPLVNKASVQLHKTRARRDLFPGIFCREDTAHTDQRNTSTG